jgi:hypothetical protein
MVNMQGLIIHNYENVISDVWKTVYSSKKPVTDTHLLSFFFSQITIFFWHFAAYQTGLYICLLSTSIHKDRSLSVLPRLRQFTVEKNVLEFLNDLKFILYLKYDNFSTIWRMDTPTFVANYLRQSLLYSPTWNTQKHLIFLRQYRRSSE